MGNNGFTINAKLYDFLKWVALVLLPAAAALYVTVGGLWHFGAISEVVGTITAIDTFLGLLLNKVSMNFAKEQVVGDIVVTQDAEGLATGMKLVAHRDPLVFDDQKLARFNVKREQEL